MTMSAIRNRLDFRQLAESKGMSLEQLQAMTQINRDVFRRLMEPKSPIGRGTIKAIARALSITYMEVRKSLERTRTAAQKMVCKKSVRWIPPVRPKPHLKQKAVSRVTASVPRTMTSTDRWWKPSKADNFNNTTLELSSSMSTTTAWHSHSMHVRGLGDLSDSEMRLLDLLGFETDRLRGGPPMRFDPSMPITLSPIPGLDQKVSHLVVSLGFTDGCMGQVVIERRGIRGSHLQSMHWLEVSEVSCCTSLFKRIDGTWSVEDVPRPIIGADWREYPMRSITLPDLYADQTGDSASHGMEETWLHDKLDRRWDSCDEITITPILGGTNMISHYAILMSHREQIICHGLIGKTDDRIFDLTRMCLRSSKNNWPFVAIRDWIRPQRLALVTHSDATSSQKGATPSIAQV